MSLPTAEQQRERKSRIAAILGTLVFHILLVLALLFMAFRTPLPLPGEEGVEVNLGYSDDGMGDIQPEEAALLQNTAPSQPAPSADEESVTENNTETPAIEKINKKTSKETSKPVVINKPQPEVPKQPTVNQNALYKGKSTQSKPGGSQGITGKPGDQGNPNGTPGSTNYEGSGGKGNGPKFDLGNRGVVSFVKPIYNSTEQGYIVVSIKVDRLGNVIETRVNPKGTQISEIGLQQQALIAARQTKFVADPNAPEEQRGTITYKFVKMQ